jgi:hypothetical protein
MPELDGEVFVLNWNNFASTLANHDVALVKFYAPWYVGRRAYRSTPLYLCFCSDAQQ